MNLRVTRNGQPEKIAKTERTSDSIAYYFGDKDVFIETNTFHDYTISYEVGKAILQFAESDQLYWNIIPFFWEFPINNVSATVKFPKKAKYLAVDIFIGSFESEKNDLNVSYSETSDGKSFQGTGCFKRNQELTARIKFEPRLVSGSENYPVLSDAYRKAEKDAEDQKLYYNFIKKLIFTILSITVILVTALMWYRVGREKTVITTVFPQFYPPENISVLAARYILRQGNVDKTRMFTIALVSLASKGIILSSKKIALLEAVTWSTQTQNKPSKGEKIISKIWT